jgi:hypothetical protein
MFPSPYNRYQGASASPRMRATDRLINPLPDFESIGKALKSIRQQDQEVEQVEQFGAGKQWAQENESAIQQAVAGQAKELSEIELKSLLREMMQQGLGPVLPQTIEGGLVALGRSHSSGFARELQGELEKLPLITQDGEPVLDDREAQAAYARVFQRYSTSGLMRAPAARDVFTQQAQEIRDSFLGQATRNRLEAQYKLAEGAAKESVAASIGQSMLGIYASPDRILTPEERNTASLEFQEVLDREVGRLRAANILAPAGIVADALDMVVENEMVKEAPDMDMLLDILAQAEDYKVGSATLGENALTGPRMVALRGRVRELGMRAEREASERDALRDARLSSAARSLFLGPLQKAAEEGRLADVQQELLRTINDDKETFVKDSDKAIAREALGELLIRARTTQNQYEAPTMEAARSAIKQNQITQEMIQALPISLSAQLELLEELEKQSTIPPSLTNGSLASNTVSSLVNALGSSGLTARTRQDMMPGIFDIHAQAAAMGSELFREFIGGGDTPAMAEQKTHAQINRFLLSKQQEVIASLGARQVDQDNLAAAYKVPFQDGDFDEALQALVRAEQAGAIPAGDETQIRRTITATQALRTAGAASIGDPSLTQTFSMIEDRILRETQLFATTPVGAREFSDNEETAQAQLRLRVSEEVNKIKQEAFKKTDDWLKEQKNTADLQERAVRYMREVVIPEIQEARRATVQTPEMFAPATKALQAIDSKLQVDGPIDEFVAVRRSNVVSPIVRDLIQKPGYEPLSSSWFAENEVSMSLLALVKTTGQRDRASEVVKRQVRVPAQIDDPAGRIRALETDRRRAVTERRIAQEQRDRKDRGMPALSMTETLAIVNARYDNLVTPEERAAIMAARAPTTKEIEEIVQTERFVPARVSPTKAAVLLDRALRGEGFDNSPGIGLNAAQAEALGPFHERREKPWALSVALKSMPPEDVTTALIRGSLTYEEFMAGSMTRGYFDGVELTQKTFALPADLDIFSTPMFSSQADLERFADTPDEHIKLFARIGQQPSESLLDVFYQSQANLIALYR